MRFEWRMSRAVDDVESRIFHVFLQIQTVFKTENLILTTPNDQRFCFEFLNSVMKVQTKTFNGDQHEWIVRKHSAIEALTVPRHIANGSGVRMIDGTDIDPREVIGRTADKRRLVINPCR